MQYKRLLKDHNGKLFRKSCTAFPNIASKKIELVKGWSGNEDGFKDEIFKRHDENSKHVACMKELEKIHASLSNNIISDVRSWAKKLPASTNDELRSQFIAANIVATQNLSSSTFAPILTGFKMVGAPVGTTHRNRYGFHLLNAVEVDRLVKEHNEVLQNERMFGLQGDGFVDKARKAQEAPNVRKANKNSGMPRKEASRSHSLIWQQMDICSEFTKQAQFCN